MDDRLGKKSGYAWLILVFFCACSCANNEVNTGADNSNDASPKDSKDGSSSDGGGTPSVSCKFNSDCPEGYICNDDMVCQRYEKPDSDDDDDTLIDDDDNNETTASKCTVRFNCPSEPWWESTQGNSDERFNGLETVTDYSEKIKTCNEDYKSMLTQGEIAVDLSLMKKYTYSTSSSSDGFFTFQVSDADRRKCFPSVNEACLVNFLGYISYDFISKDLHAIWNYGGIAGRAVNALKSFYGFWSFYGANVQCKTYSPLVEIKDMQGQPIFIDDFINSPEGGHEIVSGEGVVAVRGWYKEEPNWQTEKIYIYDPSKPEDGFKPIINTRDFAPDWPLLMRQIHDGWLVFGGFGDDLYYVDYKNPGNKRNIMEEYKKLKGEKFSDYVLLETDGYKIIWGEKYKLNEDDLYSKTDLILFEIPATPTDNSGDKLQKLTEDINVKLGHPFRIGATAIKGVWVGFCEYKPDSFSDRYSDVYAYNLETKQLYSFGRRDTVYIQMAEDHLCYIDERRTKPENPLYLKDFTHDELKAIICIDLQSPEMEQYRVK